MRGSQHPRIYSVPDYVSSTGQEAIELAAMAGLVLDEWQQKGLTDGLGETAEGRWAALEVALVVPRQNGKTQILIARELAGLFLLGERLIIHSAHEFATSREAFRQLEFLIKNTPEFDRRVVKNGYHHSHGSEGIELKNGQRIEYRTRTAGGGRGFSGDVVLFDEAMILPDEFIGALMPTVSGRSVSGNPQLWYAGSAVDQLLNPHGVVLSRLRARGLKGNDPSLAYLEWSLDYPNPSDVPADVLVDREAYALANPGLGTRIAAALVENEQRSLPPRAFAVERLGIGEWARLEGDSPVIDIERWDGLVDGSSALDPVCFAFDVTPDRSSSSIAVAGRRRDGLLQIEVVENARGTGWVVGRLLELVERHSPGMVACDVSGPAASLLQQLEDAGVVVETVSAKEHAQACGLFFDAVEQRTLRHLGSPELSLAIRGAAKRPLGEAWAWSRRGSATDISPLVACTLALWAAAGERPAAEPMVAFA